MQRVRQRNSPSYSAAAWNRAAIACALSMAAHVLLIYTVALPQRPGVAVRDVVIDARLEMIEMAATEAHAAPRSPVPPRPVARIPLASSPPPAERVDDAPAVPAPPAALPGPDATTAQAPHSPGALESPPQVQPDAAADSALLPPDPVHYAARELDVYPRALRPIVPSPPEAVQDAHQRGTVTLLVKIDESGRVVDATVVDATAGDAFDRAAREAVTATPFYPAQRAGRIVRSQLLVKVEFNPETR